MRVALVDLQYHDVNRERGLFYRLQRRDMVDRMVTDEEISHPVEHPPETTRARLRGEFIKRAKERKRTTPSTGFISSSTIRPSGPFCARTRSRRTTSVWTSSSHRSRQAGNRWTSSNGF